MPLLESALRRHWGLEAGDWQILQEGNGRRVWRVLTADGPVVVKQAASAPPGLDAMDQLAGAGFPHVLSLRRTIDGSTHVVHEGQATWVMDWVDGAEPPDDPRTHGELGRIAALLNEVKGFTKPRTQGITEVIDDLLGRAAPGPEYVTLVEGLAVLEGEPQALVHGEINRANARLTAGGQIVVLDWDDLGRGVTWLEPGYPLIHVFLDESLRFDRAAAAAYYQAYTGGAGFTAAEGDLVFAAATLHALRYLPWGDSAARWQRLLHAQEHKAELASVLCG